MNDMPLYQCHKRVRAFKIASVERDAAGWHVHPCDAALESVLVPAEYVQKHQPTPGGYYVDYGNAYASFSPARDFEAGYTAVNVLEDRRDQLTRRLADINAAIAAQGSAQ